MINVTCTWGDGPDVLVTCDRVCDKTYIDLTADEALKLAVMLVAAAASAKELQKSCEEYHKDEVS